MFGFFIVEGKGVRAADTGLIYYAFNINLSSKRGGRTMKHKLLFTLGLIVLGWAVVAAVPAGAYVGDGGYYATPSWDQTLPSWVRFIVLTNMKSQAVLDKETGFVWEQSPGIHTMSWYDAQNHCNVMGKGNRLGWRLPTLQELSSLVDPSVPSPGPTLPGGHPFDNIETNALVGYWSATTVAGDPARAYVVNFNLGAMNAPADKTTDEEYVWCVRGGQGVDPQ